MVLNAKVLKICQVCLMSIVHINALYYYLFKNLKVTSCLCNYANTSLTIAISLSSSYDMTAVYSFIWRIANSWPFCASISFYLSFLHFLSSMMFLMKPWLYIWTEKNQNCTIYFLYLTFSKFVHFYWSKRNIVSRNLCNWTLMNTT